MISANHLSFVGIQPENIGEIVGAGIIDAVPVYNDDFADGISGFQLTLVDPKGSIFALRITMDVGGEDAAPGVFAARADAKL